MSRFVQTQYGTVSGSFSTGVSRWLGIPYAKATRFQKPVRPDAWEGVKETTAYAPKCPQLAIPVNPDNGLPQSEDCLYMNIWAPENAQNCPVLFWIYGGAFSAGEGSDSMYDGEQFVKNGDVIVVTFNYRVGLFGGFYNFSNCPKLEGKYVHNAGIYDCIAALEWVKENIAAFGGDPDRVTMAGESAGAVISAVLMHTPQAKGLFQQVILESVADLAFTPKENTFMSGNLLKGIGLSEDTADQLLTMSQADIMERLIAMTGNNASISGASCIIDGELVAAPLCHTIKNGTAAVVPVLAGTNQDEGVIFANPKQEWNKQVETMLQGMLQLYTLKDPAKTLEAYQPISDAAQRKQALTDRMFKLPTKLLLDKQCEQAPTFAYAFNYAPPVAKAIGNGAFHSAEMIYVFHNLTCPAAGIIHGAEEEAGKVSDMMHQAWISFIKNGDPGWATYTKQNGEHQIFDAIPAMGTDYAAGLEELWQ